MDAPCQFVLGSLNKVRENNVHIDLNKVAGLGKGEWIFGQFWGSAACPRVYSSWEIYAQADRAPVNFLHGKCARCAIGMGG